MTKEEAIKVVKSNWPEGRYQLSEALKTLIPELAESEDEKTRKTLLKCCDAWEKGQSVCVNTKDIPLIRTWLEKKKEPYYTKRNALFDKCVENCNTEIMQGVLSEIAETPQKEACAWLNALSDAFQNSHWKPSEHQMAKLSNIITELRKDQRNTVADFLASLQSDLKKLI